MAKARALAFDEPMPAEPEAEKPSEQPEEEDESPSEGKPDEATELRKKAKDLGVKVGPRASIETLRKRVADAEEDIL